MRKRRILLAALALIVPLMFFGCSGSDGNQGAAGAAGASGGTGATGTAGSATAVVTSKHGTAVLEASDLSNDGKYRANVTINSATANASGAAVVEFTVTNGSTPITGITAVSAAIAKLVPAGNGLSYNRWVPYIYRPGKTVNAGYRENNTSSTPRGTLAELGGGRYTYTFGTNLSTAAFAFPVDGQTLVGYDRARTHRVSVYMGGHSGPTGEGDFDFVPNGAAVTETRNIVVTATCQKCHGTEFAGHGGDRVTVEGCVTCHSPNSYMVNTAANGGATESIEMAVMIHKLHAGRELPSSLGPDNQFYDNPWTASVESSDNYKIDASTPYAYTVGSLSATWRTAAFPAVLSNCQVCHAGSGQNVDNWKNVPSRAACGSCHDRINWTTGAGHPDGSATSDDDCAVCHPATGIVIEKSVTQAHDWTVKDARNIPEYDIALTLSAPGNGSYFVNGESPVISIALTDKATGSLLNHSNLTEDTSGTGGAEGCLPFPYTRPTGAVATCVDGDGYLTAANVYVTGPRAQRIPVLTYNARAKVTSSNAGNWDLSAGGGAFRIIVDGGQKMLEYNDATGYEGYGADELIAGDFTATLPAAGASLNALFANPAAATPAEVAAWLNSTTPFRDRAFAYVEDYPATSVVNRLSIRSKGILQKGITGAVALNTAQPSIQVVSSPAGIFAANAFGVAGGASQARKRATGSTSATDPKATFNTANIAYTLDNVDNLMPGTYVVNVEFGDRGRGPGNDPEPPYFNYKTPSVAVATFQVKQAAVEKPIADGCQNCHWSSATNTGFVLDAPRHNKPFKAGAVDQCGGCHMYKSGMNPTTATYSVADWGTKPISRRVHAVHNGHNLNYPTITVGHEETANFGRNWDITYPMNVRNCESCHPASTTSGSWKTNPNRVACMGCHDSDAATSHMQANVFDPTPYYPWSGDEKESCKQCH